MKQACEGCNLWTAQLRRIYPVLVPRLFFLQWILFTLVQCISKWAVFWSPLRNRPSHVHAGMFAPCACDFSEALGELPLLNKSNEVIEISSRSYLIRVGSYVTFIPQALCVPCKCKHQKFQILKIAHYVYIVVGLNSVAIRGIISLSVPWVKSLTPVAHGILAIPEPCQSLLFKTLTCPFAINLSKVLDQEALLREKEVH